jgi:hypothetical protein
MYFSAQVQLVYIPTTLKLSGLTSDFCINLIFVCLHIQTCIHMCMHAHIHIYKMSITTLRGMFTIYFHTKFYIPAYNSSLGTTIKWKAKYRFCIAAILLLHILQNCTSTKSADFLKCMTTQQFRILRLRSLHVFHAGVIKSRKLKGTNIMVASNGMNSILHFMKICSLS